MSVLVSVIIPNYNHAAFLEQRIDTVLAQSYQNFELILLDDCSLDDSRDVIERYREHPKVSHIVFNKHNSGTTFKQWKKGIELAKGEWIWIAESDDWCEATLLETLVKGITDNCSMAFCQSLLVHSNGEIIWNTKAKSLEQTVAGKEFVQNDMLFVNSVVNASMCIFKKECYYTLDQKFTEYKFCGDWLFWIQIALQGDVFISGKILNYFRKHDKDVSGKSYKDGLFYSEHIKILSSLEKQNIINKKEKVDILVSKLKIFIDDARVDPKIAHEIKIMFFTNLGLDFIQKNYYKKLGKRLFTNMLAFNATKLLKI